MYYQTSFGVVFQIASRSFQSATTPPGLKLFDPSTLFLSRFKCARAYVYLRTVHVHAPCVKIICKNSLSLSLSSVLPLSISLSLFLSLTLTESTVQSTHESLLDGRGSYLLALVCVKQNVKLNAAFISYIIYILTCTFRRNRQ